MKRKIGRVSDALRNTFLALPIITVATLARQVSAAFVSLDIIGTLNYVQSLLMHIGPMLSGILFIIAGICYALGQLFPSHQRASFHTTSIDLIIGAIIVAALSIASGGFALASTHLLSNLTNSS
ncbi:MAG: hypothetical protein KGH64_03580 [Candidatus Micrarchaeota archaeon]|nr:hypothetical protein [Candidatus Micrarchaeota archaeon]MDE1834391.1 hypothetical protein [Candidatus Micrarchaeota archaeon]